MEQYYKDFLTKLRNSKFSKSVKIGFHSHMKRNYETDSPSGMFSINDIRYNFLNTVFEGTFPFDANVNSVRNFLLFKYLCDIFDDIEILYFNYDDLYRKCLCLFKLKNKKHLKDCIFEILASESILNPDDSAEIDENVEIDGEKSNILSNNHSVFSVNVNFYSLQFPIYYKYRSEINNHFVFPEKYYKNNPPKNKIHLIRESGSSFLESVFYIQKIEKKNYENYPESLTDSFNNISSIINDNPKGIILLHGDKGCGKTTLIKYCISNSDKKFYYITGESAVNFSGGNFLEFIAQRSRNSVFVFEDMEFLLHSRESKGSSLVSDLLNASDGILSDIIKPLFIFTFNTNLKNIDTAFLRPGRLLYEQEFMKLSFDEAKLIASANNIVLNEEKEYSIAEIFNSKKNTNSRSKIFASENGQKIGFGTSGK